MVGDTIAVGIDLGTTNSSVAISRNGRVEIVKKPGGVEYTPSVFGFDKSKNRVVGQKAYDALAASSADEEAQNYKPEVKRIIGTPETFYFARAGVSLTAEEISAEILKSLKQDIQRKYPDFDTGAAVITIPAAFSVLQCEATKRAGELAGFDQVVLLQEPIAAAIAYGFSAEKDETWLVYDLGGGTFDVAIVLSRDGVLSVLGHGGDNFLGGKNIDAAIVDKLLVPFLASRFKLSDLTRENKAHAGRFARLKFYAERAKIELSSYDVTTIELDGLGTDDRGEPIEATLELTAAQLESAMAPVLNRTIELCRSTLSEVGLTSANISKLILVGGPTQSPLIRSRLQKDLGIEIESGVDPITVVARGACIYALGQRRAVPSDTPVDGARAVLSYQSLTADTEITVAGRIEGIPADKQFKVQLQAEDGSFSTQPTALRAGKFIATVEVKENQTNRFWLYLLDEQGQSCQVSPDSLSITHGISVAAAPLPHSIGVSVLDPKSGGANGPSEVFDRLIEKGSILPAKATRQYRTARGLAIGRSDNPLLIRVGEGESPISDRNTFVCSLGIKGTDLPHDLPEGTSLDLTIEVNAFRELSVTAYVPSIDLRLNARATFQEEEIEARAIEEGLDDEMVRLARLERSLPQDKKERVSSTIQSINTSLQSAGTDEDNKRKAAKELRELKVLLDDVEQAGSVAHLEEQFGEVISEAEEAAARLEQNERDRLTQRLSALRSDASKAVFAGDKVILTALIERASEIRGYALRQDPMVWLQYFQAFEAGHIRMRAGVEIEGLLDAGRKAIANNDVEGLKQCCLKLDALSEDESKRAGRMPLAGIMK